MSAWVEGVGPVEMWACCQEWPIAVLFPVGRCGKCGQYPKAKGSA